MDEQSSYRSREEEQVQAAMSARHSPHDNLFRPDEYAWPIYARRWKPLKTHPGLVSTSGALV